jgi:hypothetical protein
MDGGTPGSNKTAAMVSNNRLAISVLIGKSQFVHYILALVQSPIDAH